MTERENVVKFIFKNKEFNNNIIITNFIILSFIMHLIQMKQFKLLG